VTEVAKVAANEGGVPAALDVVKQVSPSVLTRAGLREEEGGGDSSHSGEGSSAASAATPASTADSRKPSTTTTTTPADEESASLALEALAQLCATKEGTRSFEEQDGFKLVYPLCALEQVNVRARLAMLLQRVIDNRSREENNFLSKEILPQVSWECWPLQSLSPGVSAISRASDIQFFLFLNR
jgi:hypothetical protein